MKLSATILQKILTDLTFSRDLSAILKVKQLSVERSAQRAIETGKTLTLVRPEAIAFYKKCGFTEEEIFETEPAQ